MKRNKWYIIVVGVFFLVGIMVYHINDYDYATIYDQNGEELVRLEAGWDKNFGEESLLQGDIVVDSVIYQLIEDMEKSGFNQEEIIKGLNYSGWKVYSTISVEIQKELSTYYSIKDTFNEIEEQWENIPQSSMVVMNYNGEIQALVGGTNGDNQCNRARRKLYQIGSTIKPVSIYAPILNDNLIHYSSLVEDIPTSIYLNGKLTEWPTNADGKYEGQITIADALAVSKNAVPVILGNQYGTEKIYNYLKDNFYSTMVNENMRSDIDVSALAMGYFNDGVSLDELVGSYVPFGNDGKYRGVTCYTHVKDKNNKDIFEYSRQDKQIMSGETAYIINRLLLNNVEAENGIAKGARMEGVEVAGKTGTVGKDGRNIRKLFVGMTPEYVIGLQFSYDEIRPLMGNELTNTAIWRNYVETINLKEKEFKKNDNVVSQQYCIHSGGTPGDSCEKVAIGYYTMDNFPDECTKCEYIKNYMENLE